ncbi:peptidylprolyl isomerase [Ammoniphilus sp. YIM 78166]|uniref:peptidylprolyl isomerase n=1 Tax=Ammoniphilus sp. YIM 78166 TaxID=1644106 RepID=UPI00106F6D89|nr:peptidylprolyl isomerase [Ammoniphilus sp. YIM 78166]
MKKIAMISILATTLLWTTVSEAAAPAFRDVNGHWASVSIQWAVEAGVIKGYEDGTFKPNAFVTEAEFITMLFRALPAQTNVEKKMDKHWADPFYQQAAAFLYPVRGQESHVIRNQPIRRNQVAELIAAANGDPFEGDPAIRYIISKKLASGKIKHDNPLEAFKGNDLLTRAEAVQFLLNAIQNGLQEAKSSAVRGETSTKKWSKPPEMIINPQKNYQATVVTNMGQFTIELFADQAPKTVNNFIFLSQEGYYKNILFHRVIKDFMIQTGDPTGTGTGGPGYQFEDELNSKTKYEKGIVAMANAGPNTNGSQFFICNGPDSEFLNNAPHYTIFGRIIDGMSTIDALSNVSVKRNHMGEPSTPVEEVFIHNIFIQEKLD